MQKNAERDQRTRQALQGANLDALIVRLSENVLLLSGYWPMNGFAFLIFPLTRDPILIAPVPEEELAHESRVEDIRTFPWGLVDSGDPFSTVKTMIQQAAQDLDLVGKRVGYEGSFEFIAAPYVAAEPGVPSQVSISMYHQAFGDRLVDATNLIHTLRKNKTPAEVEHLRKANHIACLGLSAFFEAVQPGQTEIAIASAVESAIMEKGTGLDGVKVARAWASVMSGPRSANAYKPHLLSTQRRLEPGDLALLELASVVDGWWSDLTRTRVAGFGSNEDLERWQAVVDAQQAAIAAIRPGVPAKEVDRAARDLLEQRGLGSYFIHHTGHGLGLRYHEPEPFLHPEVDTPLEVGMVSSVEPGIYIPNWGGMRCEDNILVTPDGVEILSEYSRALQG